VLVTLVAAKEVCFQKPFKTIEAVRISKFIWQQVHPDCQASIVKSLAAMRAKMTCPRKTEMGDINKGATVACHR